MAPVLLRRSTLHRVEKRSAGERYSSPFFCAPNWDAVIGLLPGCESAEVFAPVSAVCVSVAKVQRMFRLFTPICGAAVGPLPVCGSSSFCHKL